MQKKRAKNGQNSLTGRILMIIAPLLYMVYQMEEVYWNYAGKGQIAE